MPGICECCAAKTKDLGHELAGAQGASPQSTVASTEPSRAEPSESCNSRKRFADQRNRLKNKINWFQHKITKKLTQCELLLVGGSRPVEAQPDQAETHCWSIARAAVEPSRSERAVKILFPQRSFSCVFDFSSCRTILQLSSVRVLFVVVLVVVFGAIESLSRRGR